MEGPDPTDEAFGDLDPPGNSTPFVLRPPFEEVEVVAMEKNIRAAVERGLRVLHDEGAETFVERYLNKETKKSVERCELGNADEEATESAIIDGSPRPYQLAFFEKCKRANTIVHLGTGQGKTLVALLCMQHFSGGFALSTEPPDAAPGRSVGAIRSEAKQTGKQAWFLVPSVALAVQHTVTIRVNLPLFKVATACNTTSCSEKARSALANAHVVVATHGSALDLLRYYGDSFHLGRINLLIFDECHYATGNHGYAQLLETFYHRTQPAERPRIVGLTASPIINVKKNTSSPGSLEKLLSELENKLNSKLVCFSDLGEPSQECLKAIERNVEEQLVEFDNGQTSFLPLPNHNNIGLHKSREKELNQLQNLYDELGPCITGEYCTDLANELSRSKYEGETADQFEKMVSHLKSLSTFCSQQCAGRDKGQTKKLVCLLNLLHKMLTSGEDPEKEGVGLVFVERRITALALHGYLRRRQMKKKSTANDTIRCDCLVRQSHQVFKYLHKIHKLGSLSEEYQDVMKEAEQDWLHQTKKIRTVLDELRRKEINLLIATSSVEEGVDVSACSFVIVLDGIKTTKSYVQMKGRARQKRAKFFCFRDTGSAELTVPLNDAQRIDEEVRRFLGQREENVATEDVLSAASSHMQTVPTSMSEEDALMNGEYVTKLARVDRKSSKALLNHYFLSVPMDSAARASKETMKLQLPIFQDATLILPAHLPPEIRKCTLPLEYSFLRKKTREELLALMAVVRLHEHGLVSDRLLPLQRSDLHQVLAKQVLPELPPPPDFHGDEGSFGRDGSKMYLHPLIQKGDRFSQHSSVLGNEKRTLGLLSASKLPDELSVVPMSFDHSDMGLVSCNIGAGTELRLSAEEWENITDFYSVLINARWRRRTGRLYFCFDHSSTVDTVVPKTAVVVLTDDGSIDFARMSSVKSDYERSETARIAAIRETRSATQRVPRLWAPIYSPNSTYISFSPSNLTCSARFPNHEYATYQDYFQRKHSYVVDSDCLLFRVQHLWTEPRNMTPVTKESSFHLGKTTKNKKQRTERMGASVEGSLQDGECSPCLGLRPALLPEDACMEAPLADASLYLQCILLPQILYELNRRLVTSAFVLHCGSRFDRLGVYLKQARLANIVEVLTAKSCSVDLSYDRLEYIGDAVLKLLHTDVLLHSSRLKQWTKCLHEGDLTKLRSEMGCNERLSNAARSAGIDRFILTMPLARGCWAPHGFIRKKRDKDVVSSTDLVAETDYIAPSTKVCADVVEAILGFVYIDFGYEAAAKVAEELLISLPHSTGRSDESASVSIDTGRFSQAEKFVGRKFERKALIKEALTHASCLFTNVPSYQKLEWAGDAVLCLAAREWAFTSYPSLSVADLVIIETTIVCNETLSCTAVRNGLHGLIHHADTSLPGRIETFALSLRGDEWGLWGSNPPKVLADVVEALIGACHVDGGFREGQRSALLIVKPLLDALATSVCVDEIDSRLKVEEGAMMHPKQVLSEMGRFLRVRVSAEAVVAEESLFPVWRRKAWSKASFNGDDAICHVSCLGMHLGAVSESSNIVARNRACAIISEVFRRNHSLLEMMQEISTNVSTKEAV